MCSVYASLIYRMRSLDLSRLITYVSTTSYPPLPPRPFYPHSTNSLPLQSLTCPCIGQSFTPASANLPTGNDLCVVTRENNCCDGTYNPNRYVYCQTLLFPSFEPPLAVRKDGGERERNPELFAGPVMMGFPFHGILLVEFLS